MLCSFLSIFNCLHGQKWKSRKPKIIIIKNCGRKKNAKRCAHTKQFLRCLFLCINKYHFKIGRISRYNFKQKYKGKVKEWNSEAHLIAQQQYRKILTSKEEFYAFFLLFLTDVVLLCDVNVRSYFVYYDNDYDDVQCI